MCMGFQNPENVLVSKTFTWPKHFYNLWYWPFPLNCEQNMYIWNEKIESSQLFCEIVTLSEININWKWRLSIEDKLIGKDNFSIINTLCISLQHFYNAESHYYTFVASSFETYSLIVSTNEILNFIYLIFFAAFHFILILGRVTISQKSSDDSIFSHHRGICF